MTSASIVRRYPTVLAAGMIAGTAVAQTSPAPVVASDEIQEIVVTAQKRSESINKVPMSITAASGEQLRTLGIRDVGDLTKIVPGFRYTQSAYAAPIYSIRGIGFNESSLGAKPNVSVYVDEVPLPLSILTAGATLDLERVEVLKGPQGTLFGQNTTGGAINYIAAKPTPDFEAGADVSYSRFDLFQGSGFVSGPVTPTLSVRAAVSTDQGGAWQRSYTRDDRLGRRNKTEGRVLVDWRPSTRLKFNLSLTHYTDQSDEQAAQLVAITPLKTPNIYVPLLDNYPLAPHNDRAADWDAGQEYKRDNHFDQIALRSTYNITDAISLTSLTSYIHFTMDRDQDPDGTSYQNIEYTTLGNIHSFDQELRLAGTSGRLKWIIGGNFERVKVDQIDYGRVSYDTNAYALAAFGGPFFNYYNSSYQRFTSKAAFANLDYALTDRLTVRAAGRYTGTDINFRGCTGDAGDGVLAPLFTNFANYVRGLSGLPPVATPAPGSCVTLNSSFVPGQAHETLDQNNFSWRTSLDYKLSPDVLLYGNVSKGYKAGSFPILSASADSQLVPVKQESVLAYEAGFKATLADRTLQISGAGFYYDYRNKQVRGRVIVPIFGPLETLVNVPKSRVLGAEMQMLWKPYRGVTVNLGGTYVSSKILDHFVNYDPYGNVKDFEGEAYPLTSKWQADADLGYEWSLGSQLSAFIGANLNYQSATNGGLGDLPVLKINGYALLDLRAGVQSPDGRWRIEVWGRNVTDKYYWTIADHIADTTVRFAGMPATFGATLSLRFK